MFRPAHSLAPLLAALLLASACGGAAKLDFPGTPEGGKALIDSLVKSSDRPALIAKLKPAKEDLEALFDASIVADIQTQVDKMYSQIGDVGPKEGQTEVLFFSATPEDFKAASDAAKKFPGGYARIAEKLKPGVLWCGWKFVKPGETLGMAFDGLAFVNNHWVWVPKPFRAVKGDGS
jgi:cytochrome c556